MFRVGILCCVVLCSLIQLSLGNVDDRFPPDFKFGAGTSSYQVEGGWNADGKGQNIWDRHIHQNPNSIPDNGTGDIAADSYHLWREDVRIAKEMGLQFYRFSINWPRILPTGFVNEVNEAGVKYYSDLIDALLEAGIEPMVTIYHWEMPVKILDLGGWANPLIANWFGDFARVVFELYADRVKTWITINESVMFCDFFYNIGQFIKEPQFGPFLCNKHVLLAHAKAYRIYEKDFKPKYGGKISLSNSIFWIEPATPNDQHLAELARENAIGRYSHPIHSKKGGWPPSIEKFMLEYSLKQGYKESRLPAFTKEEIEFIKGTSDYYALNHYSTFIIRPAKPGEKGVWFMTGSPELNAMMEFPNGGQYGRQARALSAHPEGLRPHLAWLKKQYGDIDIFITENGYPTSGYNLLDYDRIDIMKKYFEQVQLSMKLDNVSVIGFGVWSLMDNFEWIEGYNTKFGLYEVNFEDPKRTRTARASSYFYKCLIQSRSLRLAERCVNENPKFKRTEKQNGGNLTAIKPSSNAWTEPLSRSTRIS